MTPKKIQDNCKLEPKVVSLEKTFELVTVDIREIKDALSAIAKSLSSLAVLENKHIEVKEALTRAFRQIDENSKDIVAIKLELPNLKLASNWLFKAVVYLVAILGATALTTIFTKLM